MINIYRNQKDFPENLEYVQLNDVYFNEVTFDLLDERAKEIVEKIDGTEILSKYKVKSRFGDEILNIDKLSSGCKTVLNVLYNSDKVFWIMECGENALEVLFQLEKGNVYCETPMIPFEFSKVRTWTGKDSKEISDYEELKEWWQDEE